MIYYRYLQTEHKQLNRFTTFNNTSNKYDIDETLFIITVFLFYKV